MRDLVITSEFTVSSILSSAWSVIQKNLIVFLGIVLLKMTTWAVLNKIFEAYKSQLIFSTVGVGDVFLIVIIIVILIITALVNATTGSVTTCVVFELLSGEWDCVMVSIKRCAGRIPSAIFGYFICSIVLVLLWFISHFSFILGIFAIFFIIRIIIKWFVFIPACIVENKGPIESLSRSSELIKGKYFWNTFLVFLLTDGLSMVLYYFIVKLAIRDGIFFYIIINALIMSIPYTFTSVLPAVIYYKLRVAKENFSLYSLYESN